MGVYNAAMREKRRQRRLADPANATMLAAWERYKADPNMTLAQLADACGLQTMTAYRRLRQLIGDAEMRAHTSLRGGRPRNG